VPCQLPIRNANGVSSIGRSSGRTNKLLLALEEFVEHEGGNCSNRQRGKNQKAGENKFDCEEHGSSLTNQGEQGEQSEECECAGRDIDLLTNGVLRF